MAYQKSTWANTSAGNTPLNAARMNKLETQYDEALAEGDKRYAPMGGTVQAGRLAKIAVQQKTHSKGFPYAVIRAYAGGSPIPGLIDKRYGSDFDETNPTSTGAAFRPPRERVDSMARRTGNTVAVNASGWKVSGNVEEVRGVQIRNGKLFHDFEATNLNGSPAGIEGIGVLADGRLKCYSALRGDTAAKMLADGVVHAWSYGPNLVINGVKQDLTQANWQYFLTEISARTIVGQAQNGDIIIIATVGKTNGVGIAGNEMVDLAAAEGCYNATLFDGGGSTQAYVQGYYTVPSSDDRTGYDGYLGRRSVPDVFMFSGALGTASVDTGWMDIALASGYKANSTSQVPQIRQIDGVIECRGQVAPTSGVFGTDQVVIGNIPQQFRTNQAAKVFTAIGNGDNTRKGTYQNLDEISIVGSAASSPTYMGLDGLRFGPDTP